MTTVLMIDVNDPIYPIYENMATVETKMRWALDNPGMYTVEELQQIQEEYDAACKAMDEYLHADFHSMPEEMQRAILKLLANDEKNKPSFWLDILQPEPPA